MSKKLSFILECLDRTSSTLSKASSGFDKVANSAKNAQSKITLLPNSIGSLEKKLDGLKDKQKNAFTVEGIKHYQKEINATEKQLDRLNSVKHGGGLKGVIGQLGDKVPGLGGIASTLTSPAAIGIGTALAVGKTLYSATEKAMIFEQGMAKVNGTLHLSKPELEDVRNQLLKLGKSKNSITDLNLIPDTFNKIVSAGLELPDAMDVMDKSLKGSKAGFTEVNNVADATTNILNSVGKSNTNATEVMDVLFATLNKGKGEFVDVANYLPKVIPISNQLGLSFKETSGAFAFLTANGLKAEASTTALQNVFKALQDSKVRQQLHAIGINVFDAHGKMRSLKDVSVELSKSLGGLTDEERTKKLQKLGLDQEASLGLSLMSQNAKDLASTIDYVTGSAGELDRTLVATENPMNTIKQLGNQFEGLMTSIGYKILPYVNVALEKVLGFVTGVVDGISSAYEKSELFRDVMSGLGTVFSGIWEGATAYFSVIGDQFDKVTKQMEEYGYSWSKVGDNIEAAYTWHKKQIQGFVSGSINILKLLKQVWDDLWSGNTESFKKLSFSSIQETFNKGYYDVINKKEEKASGWQMPSIVTDQMNFANKLKGLKDNKKKEPVYNGNSGGGSQKKDLADGVDSIVGGGKGVKNITINVTKLIESLTIMSQDLKEGVGDMQDMVENALLRVLNNANTIGANG